MKRVVIDAEDTLTLANSIFFENQGGRLRYEHTFIESNNLMGIDPGFVRAPSPGPDGIWGSADDDYGDLRLASGESPAVDAGDSSASYRLTCMI